MTEQLRSTHDIHPRMLRSTGTLPDAISPFSKTHRASPGRSSFTHGSPFNSRSASSSSTIASELSTSTPVTTEIQSSLHSLPVGLITHRPHRIPMTDLNSSVSNRSAGGGGGGSFGSNYGSHRSAQYPHHNYHSHHYHQNNFRHRSSYSPSSSSYANYHSFNHRLDVGNGGTNHNGSSGFESMSSSSGASGSSLLFHHNSPCYSNRQGVILDQPFTRCKWSKHLLQDFMVHQWQQFMCQHGLPDASEFVQNSRSTVNTKAPSSPFTSSSSSPSKIETLTKPPTGQVNSPTPPSPSPSSGISSPSRSSPGYATSFDRTLVMHHRASSLVAAVTTQFSIPASPSSLHSSNATFGASSSASGPRMRSMGQLSRHTWTTDGWHRGSAAGSRKSSSLHAFSGRVNSGGSMCTRVGLGNTKMASVGQHCTEDSHLAQSVDKMSIAVEPPINSTISTSIDKNNNSVQVSDNDILNIEHIVSDHLPSALSLDNEEFDSPGNLPSTPLIRLQVHTDVSTLINLKEHMVLNPESDPLYNNTDLTLGKRLSIDTATASEQYWTPDPSSSPSASVPSPLSPTEATCNAIPIDPIPSLSAFDLNRAIATQIPVQEISFHGSDILSDVD